MEMPDESVDAQVSALNSPARKEPEIHPATPDKVSLNLLQPKRHTVEYLREQAYLRPRTNLFSAVFRVRSILAYAIHSFFNERGFVYVHTPIITSSDCEGAGEMFRVTTLDMENPPRTESGEIDYSQDFFGKSANLTVSGQLNGETYAMAFKNIYTFGPTFRAENSNTQRHASEFWMMEPEIAFADLKDDMELAEDMIKFVIRYVMEECAAEMEKLGISLTDNEGKMKTLDEIMQELRIAFNSLSETEQTAAAKHIAGANAMSGLLAIVNAAPEDFEKLTSAVANSEGAAESMSKTMLDNLGGDMTLLSSKLEGIELAIYEKLEPALRKGAEMLDKLLDMFSYIVEHGGETIATITGIAAAFAAWKFVGIITAVTTALKGMTIAEMAAAAKTWLLNTALLANPIGLLISLLAGLVAAFVVLWNKCDWFREFWINAWEKIKEVAGVAWEKIQEFFVTAWDKIQEVWGTLSEFFSNLWENAKTIFSAVADWINTNVFQPIINFFKPVVQFYITAFSIIFQIAEGCWKAIKAIWGEVSRWFNEKIIQPVKKFFSDLWEAIKVKAATTWNNIKIIWYVVSSWFKNTIIDPVAKWFTGMWDGLKDGASKAWEGIKKVFSPVADWFKQKFKKAWENVKTVFSTGGKVFEGIKDGITEAFKTVVNAIIRGINNVIAVPFNAINDALDTIRNISIAGIQPFEGLISRFDIPQIPELAKGGIVDGARKVIVGEKGKEAIIPLENNKRGLKEIAALLSREMPDVNGGNNSMSNVTYNFNQTNNSPTALSRWEIYRQTKNLISAMQGV